MTRRLTDEEKAYNKRRRELMKLPERERLFAARRIPKRTPEEVTEFRDMLKAQREQFQQRHERLAGAYAVDELRQEEDRADYVTQRRGRFFQLGARLRLPYPTTESFARPTYWPGATLAQKIAVRTETFYRDQRRAPTDGPGPWTRPRKWWQFWRPREELYVTSDDVNYLNRKPKR